MNQHAPEGHGITFLVPHHPCCVSLRGAPDCNCHRYLLKPIPKPATFGPFYLSPVRRAA